MGNIHGPWPKEQIIIWSKKGYILDSTPFRNDKTKIFKPFLEFKNEFLNENDKLLLNKKLIKLFNNKLKQWLYLDDDSRILSTQIYYITCYYNHL